MRSRQRGLVRAIVAMTVAAVVGSGSVAAASESGTAGSQRPGASMRPEAREVSSRPRPSASFDDSVLVVAYHGDVVFVGGAFQVARQRGRTTERGHLAAMDATSGRLLGWAPTTDGAVRAIAVTGDAVYIAGDFSRVNGEPRAGLAKLDAATGELDGSFDPAVSGRIRALALGEDRLYLGGSVASVDGRTRAGLAAVTLGVGRLDDEWTPVADGTVHTLAATAGRVYLGGRFRALNGSGAYRKLAAVDPDSGETETGFRPGMSVLVRDVTLASSGIYAAVGGAGGRLISFDPGGGQRWAVSSNGDFQAVTVLGDTVYAGGHFSRICATARTDPDGTCLDGSAERGRMAAFNRSGDLLGWSPDANSPVGVQAMAADAASGTVAVGGAFTTLDSGAIDQPHFAAFG